MNRIDRVSNILIQLQSKRVVKAQEIADRFNISLRTVYRDIRTLEEAGIPLIGEAGVGYSIVDGYCLPPVMFTKEEAVAFLMAGKMVEKYTDPKNAEVYESAMYKIRSVLRATEKDFLENVDENIAVIKGRHLAGEDAGSGSLQSILAAIHEKKVIEIKYEALNSQEATNRKIEPIGIFLQGSRWYLIAYCRLRKDFRNFRIDRMKDLQLTEELFSTALPTLNEYLKRVSKQEDMITVVISMDKSIAKYQEGEKYYHGFVSQVDQGDQLEMTFLVSSLEGISRWFLMMADHASIIKPAILKKHVKELLKIISVKLEGY